VREIRGIEGRHRAAGRRVDAGRPGATGPEDLQVIAAHVTVAVRSEKNNFSS
jgi:hypothetical protein